MTFVFWQGIISIHQKAFLEALALQPGVEKVVLVVEEEITAYRKNMGWEVPVIEHITIVTAPAVAEIARLVAEHRSAVHVMGGIRVGKTMAAAFDACIKADCKIGVMTEPYNPAGRKGMLRSIKYRYYRLRYFRHIQFVLAIGRQGVAQYHSLGYERSRIFPWAYFVNVPRADDAARVQPGNKIIYAGRLEPAKGIYNFVNELLAGNTGCTLDLYGAGPDEEKIRQLLAERDVTMRVSIFPFLLHEELLAKYSAYDWVVLPSSGKDGWGVIVSEGLLYGLRAICSSTCGVSWAIREGFNGVVFDWHREGDCKRAIEQVRHGAFAEPRDIARWAEAALSGPAGAAYFLQIMACVYGHEPRPGIPWEKTLDEINASR